MHPDVLVVGIKRYAVFREQHEADIADFDVAGSAYQNAPAVSGGVITNTFNGRVHRYRAGFSFHLQQRIAAQLIGYALNGNRTDDADCQRSRIISLLAFGQYVGNTDTFGCFAGAFRDAEFNCFGSFGGQIDDLRARFERSVVIVSAGTGFMGAAAPMRKACSIIGFYRDAASSRVTGTAACGNPYAVGSC